MKADRYAQSCLGLQLQAKLGVPATMRNFFPEEKIHLTRVPVERPLNTVKTYIVSVPD